MKKGFFILLATLLLFPLLAESLWAKVYIDIRSPSFRKFPIAISPFQGPRLAQRGHEAGRAGHGNFEQ